MNPLPSKHRAVPLTVHQKAELLNMLNKDSNVIFVDFKRK